MFDRIKRFYDRGLWDLERVEAVTRWGHITPEQFKEITGKEYKG